MIYIVRKIGRFIREHNYTIDPRSTDLGHTFQAGHASRRQYFYQRVWPGS